MLVVAAFVGPDPSAALDDGPQVWTTARRTSKDADHVSMITYEQTLPVSQALTWRPTMAAVSDVTTPIACYHHGGFPVAELRAMKKNQRVSACTPARDENAIVGARRGALGRIELAPQARDVRDVALRRAGVRAA